jgi:hypothetical protein
MSHFTVLVKVTNDRLNKHNGVLKDALEEMLLPYQENNMGDCPPEFLSFHDKTEEIEKSKDEVIEAGGYMAKQYPDSVGKTLLEHYGSIEELAKEYHGYKFDEKQGKYGYWENKNARWDWYQVGGRWSGILPVKPGADCGMGKKSWCNEKEETKPNFADYVCRKDLDVDKLQAEAAERAEKFWTRYNRWLEIKDLPRNQVPEDDRWLDHDMHSALYNMGVRKCIEPRKPMVNPDGTPVMEFDPYDKCERQKWTEPKFDDTPFLKEELLTKYRWHFEWGTFCVLDDNGWHEKGKMGWFGCSSDEVEDREQWGDSYYTKFIENEDPMTVFVIVDCHI